MLPEKLFGDFSRKASSVALDRGTLYGDPEKVGKLGFPAGIASAMLDLKHNRRLKRGIGFGQRNSDMNADNSNLESDLRTLLQDIDRAFGTIVPPEGWQDCVTVEDFARIYGDRFLAEYWELIYHLEGTVTLYIFPYVMRYFATNLNSGVDDDVDLDLLLQNLDPSYQHEVGLSFSYDFISHYSEEQKTVICEWMRFLYRYQTAGSSVMENVLAAWC